MQRVIAYLFLLIMINVVLFHPMSSADKEMHLVSDPVNSIAEFVVEVCFNFEDVHPGDEREAESDHFSYTKIVKASGTSALMMVRHNYLLFDQEVLVKPVIISIENFTRITTPPPEFIV